MKKKLILLTAIVLLFAIGMTLLVGCDAIFTRNEERDMTQVVARVKYNGETSEIYKFELASSFSSYAYYYVNYYGMSAEAAANYILQSLAQQRLLVLFARQQVYFLNNGIDPSSSSAVTPATGIPATENLLSPAELNKAKENANESLLSSLKSLIQSAITEDNYNSGGNTTTTPDDDEDTSSEITDPVIVRFDSNGGSEVERQRIQKNSKAEEPDDPTWDGHTFYGWYQSENFEGDEFNFDATISSSLTLYAKWADYTAPRTEIPEVEEEEDEDDDYDPDSTDEIVDAETPFFEKTIDELYDEIKDEDFVDNIKHDTDEELASALKDYIGDQLADLKTNLQNNLFKANIDQCYDYYIQNQYDSLIVDRYERLLGKNVTVTDEEIKNELDRVIRQNKESFELSDTAYSSALGSSLTSTYFHPNTKSDEQYGFVINILLRLDDEHLDKLTTMLTQNPANKAAVRIMRNKYLSELEVKVSNPAYKSTETVKNDDGEEIELRDPMTDPKNPYNNVGKETYNKSFEHKVSVEGETAVYKNDYDHIITFGKKLDENGNEIDGEYEVKFNATEHPAMAYLLETVPAFDKDGKIGIIHQIYNSFEQVKAAGFEKDVEVYWLREVASKWAYIVGDDTGAVTESSNNNGLGYLITPKGEDSSYLEDFTSYARDLITAGSGSYATGEVTNEMFEGADPNGDGTLAGNNVLFVVADSFIESGSTSNAYAGVFVLLNSYTVWDNDLYKSYSGKDLPENGELPTDFVFTLVPNADDRQSLYDIVKENLETTKKTNLYNLNVNTMGNANMNNIEYFGKAYKSLWKDYE